MLCWNAETGDDSIRYSPSVFGISHGPRRAAVDVGPMLLLPVVGVVEACVVEHVMRHGRLINVNQSRCRNLAVDLHHRYAADRRLHRLCSKHTTNDTNSKSLQCWQQKASSLMQIT